MKTHAKCLYCDSRLKKLATVRDAYCDMICRRAWEYEEKKQPKLRRDRIPRSKWGKCKSCRFPTLHDRCYYCTFEMPQKGQYIKREIWEQ